MPNITDTPLDPARHRAYIASIYASLPPHLQHDAYRIVQQWPRLIHSLASKGELVTPELENQQEIAA